MHLAPTALLFVVGVCVLMNAGCYVPPPEGLKADAKLGKKGVANLVPTIGDPIPIIGTRFVAFPFAVQVNDEGRGKLGLSPSSLGSSLGFYGPMYNENPGLYQSGTAGWRGRSGLVWNNLIVLDNDSRSSTLLFDRKVVITAAYFPDEKGSAERGLLIAAAETDTNKDGYINEGDAVVLYHCNEAGAVLTPVTPTSASQFRGLTFLDPQGRVVCVRTRVDTDGDGAFTASDETVMLRVDVGGPKVFPGRRLLPAEVTRQAYETVVPGR